MGMADTWHCKCDDLSSGNPDLKSVMVCRRAERNAEGHFFQIFQENKWRLRKQKEAAAAQRDKELSLF